MCEARRAEYVRLLDEEGMNFTQAAHAVGVSKRTGKAWRNGRTRATGRNEKPLVDWYRSTMDKPKTLHPRYLSQEERIQIADRLRLGDSIRAIARLLGRDPGTVSREVERNRNPESGGYEPYRAVFCQVGVGRFGVSFSPCERRVSGRFGVGRSCWLLVIALVIA